MITDLQSDTAPEENVRRQTYRNLRQAWRYYHRNHKVDLAILYQLTDLLERSNPDRDAEQYAHAVEAVKAIKDVLAQNRIIQQRISALMSDCLKAPDS